MNTKRFIFGPLVVGAGLVAARYLVSRIASPRPTSGTTPLETIDTYVER
jgi:hypothetical protein